MEPTNPSPRDPNLKSVGEPIYLILVPGMWVLLVLPMSLRNIGTWRRWIQGFLLPMVGKAGWKATCPHPYSDPKKEM